MISFTKSKVLGVIPVRLASTRLPEKPLKEISGKPLVQWVWERARAASTLSDLVIATDSERIREACCGFGADVVMTESTLPSGTERVAQAVFRLSKSKYHGINWDAVVNIQGDMPFIAPAVIDSSVNFLLKSGEYDISTIATPLESLEQKNSPSVVKVVIGAQGQALYFSRAAIPFSRDGASWQVSGIESAGQLALKHIGLYVFRARALSFFAASSPSALEKVEMLEQLRALEHGLRIGVCVVPANLTQNSIEVDTVEDLERAQELAAAVTTTY